MCTGVRTITNPVASAGTISQTIRTELQALEDEIASPTSGHDHDNTDSRLPAFGSPTTMAFGDAAGQGSALTYAKADHAHGSPASAAPVTQNWNDVAAEGTASTWSRSNHRHGMMASPPNIPSGTMILWDGANCPTGWSRVAALDGKMLVGGASYNTAAGGADTISPTGSSGSDGSHSHTSTHTHTLASGGGVQLTSGRFCGRIGTDLVTFTRTGSTSITRIKHTLAASPDPTDTVGSHTHTVTLNDVNNKPAYATILVCQKD